MALKNKQLDRKEKYWKQKLSNLVNDAMPAYWDHLDLRNIPDLDDVGFAYIIREIKGINMLDLNETNITNQSIRLLTNLEYVKELRLKGVTKVNNDCIEDLNKIKWIEFLHVKDTSITIDGLLGLNNLPNCKNLMFSVWDDQLIHEKMLQLKILMPDCEFTINSRPYEFENIDF